MAMLAGLQLDLFTALGNGPLTATDIAAALNVNPVKLQPLLYALVAAELLTVQDECFANTPEADAHLVQGRPSYKAGSLREFYGDIWPALLKTAATIRSGAPQHKHDFYGMSEEDMASFFTAQHSNAVAAGERLAKVCDLSQFQHVLDVGSGSGGVAIGVARSCHGVRVTASDLARVIPVTRRFIEDAGLADRVATCVADVVASPPEVTYDAAVLRNLIQVLSIDQAKAAVRHVAESLAPSGAVMIIGSMLEDSRLSPVNLVGQNLVHLNIYDDGLVPSEGDYRSILAAASLSNIEVRRDEGMPNDNVLISARKAG
jgi:hypothetical protein